MSNVVIYHNPQCRSSRDTLQLLQEKGIEPEVILYLENTPSVDELRHLGELLGKKPLDFIRTGEQEYEDHVEGKDLSDDEIFELMVQYPILIQRPIVVKDDAKAVIGRPPEEVLALL